MEATHLCGHQGSVRSGGTHFESRNERILERAAEWSAGGWSIKTKRRWTQIEGCRAALRIQPTQKDGCEDEGGCWTLQSQVWLFCFSCFLKGVRLQIEEARVDCVCVCEGGECVSGVTSSSCVTDGFVSRMWWTISSRLPLSLPAALTSSLSYMCYHPRLCACVCVCVRACMRVRAQCTEIDHVKQRLLSAPQSTNERAFKVHTVSSLWNTQSHNRKHAQDVSRCLQTVHML